MSTPSITKKLLVGALVSLPFPLLLALALDAGSGLPGDMSTMQFLGSNHGLNFYILSWIMFTVASMLAMAFVNPTSSVAEEFEGDDEEYEGDEGKEKGTVKWFNVNKGFGFITSDAGEDVFVHFRSIKGRGRRSLRQGQIVHFDITQGEKGLQAENVSVAR